MKLLLTNDDGVDAPGIRSLVRAVADLGDITVVAPREAHSGCSHRVTTNSPIRLERRDPVWVAVHGTPADCVRIGLFSLLPDCDAVIAGINAGGNLGADVYVSGTVAAVREAVLHGKRGIAISQYHRRGKEIDWDLAATWTAPVVRELLAEKWDPGVFWNVNLPHPSDKESAPPVVRCRLDPSPLPVRFRIEGDEFHYDGVYHDRTRTPGCDVDVCFRGGIAVTRLNLFD